MNSFSFDFYVKRFIEKGDMHMAKKLSILLVGESCFVTKTEYKGIDQFSETNYAEAAGVLIKALEQAGHTVTHIPCHRVSSAFPRTLEELSKFDAVLFSDIGTNSFLLLPEVVRQGKRTVNLLQLTKDYVAQGGGFCMIGGYMTYGGMDGKGKWKNSILEEILPVSLLGGDDRMEVPEGADLECVPDSHAVTAGLPAKWPYILGYNKTKAKESAEVLVSWNGDPIIAVSSWGKGRVMSYTTDCAPHWAPAAMCQWENYPKLWNNIVCWLSGEK